MTTGAPTDRRSAPLRLYHHNPRAPFLELVDDTLSAKVPKPIAHASKHWDRHFERRHLRHSELRLYFRGRAKRGAPPRVAAERTRVRTELHETLSRLIRWMLIHCDVTSRWVGKPDGHGNMRPYPLTEIAEALRRPNEKRIPISTLGRAIGRLLAAGYIWRWQGRDRKIDDDGVEYYEGKTAVLRLTERFFRLSGGAWQVRERWLEQKKLRAARKRLDEPMNAFNEFLRKVEARHPELDGWDQHRLAQERMDRFERMRAAAQANKPPPT